MINVSFAMPLFKQIQRTRTKAVILEIEDAEALDVENEP
jgi:hypothetical protein